MRKDDVLTLRIELTGTEPLVWRRAEVRADTTLASLHRIIQILMEGGITISTSSRWRTSATKRPITRRRASTQVP